MRFYEKGKRNQLFFHCENLLEIWQEFCTAFADENKSVVIPDRRHGTIVNGQEVKSTHVVCFINGCDGYVAVPIKIEDGEVHTITMKDIRKDSVNPDWFVKKYNYVANKRNMPTMNYIPKPPNI